MSFLLFALILSFLVFIHELGHFLVAKRNGIEVEEFGMGIPPRIWGKKFGGTLYSLNWLPIGGFVKLKGEDDTRPESRSEPGSFSSKSVWVRAQVLLAGVFANLLFALFVLTILFRLGVPEYTERVVVQSTVPGSAAEQLGLASGDVLVSAVGVALKETPQLAQLMRENAGREITLSVERDGEVSDKTLTVPLEGRIGVVVSNFMLTKYPLHQATLKGIEAAVMMTTQMLTGLRDLARDLIFGKGISENIAGPLGIARMTGDATALGWRFLLQFIGVLSLNLAVVNVLPFPALDGGRLLFVIIEAITRKPVNRNMEAWVHTIGMALLLLLLLLVTFQDVKRLFS